MKLLQEAPPKTPKFRLAVFFTGSSLFTEQGDKLRSWAVVVKSEKKGWLWDTHQYKMSRKDIKIEGMKLNTGIWACAISKQWFKPADTRQITPKKMSSYKMSKYLIIWHLQRNKFPILKQSEKSEKSNFCQLYSVAFPLTEAQKWKQPLVCVFPPKNSGSFSWMEICFPQVTSRLWVVPPGVRDTLAVPSRRPRL